MARVCLDLESPEKDFSCAVINDHDTIIFPLYWKIGKNMTGLLIIVLCRLCLGNG